MAPFHAHDLKKSLRPFKDWLIERGAVIHEPTNPYEVLRFDAAKGVGIVYRKSNGRLTWTEEADAAWTAFTSKNAAWRATNKTKRITTGARKRLAKVRCLFKRDGQACIYCGTPLTEETATVEHIVPLGQGGPDRMINMALACFECNNGLGNLPAAKKIAYALAKREARNAK